MKEENKALEKATSKGWKVQVKKLEVDLVAQGSKDKENKATKKLLDEKDKQIENLQKKLKIPVTDHPEIDEIMAYKKKNDDLKEEVLDIKSKLLRVEQEKQELMNKVADQIVPIASQAVDT